MRKRRLRDERGASAVEFAFIVPLLLLLVLGIVEFAHAFQVQGTLSAAAREGVRVMALHNDAGEAKATVRAAADSLNPGITDAQISISPSSCPQTATSTTLVRLTITYPKPFLTDLFGAEVELTGSGVMRCNG